MITIKINNSYSELVGFLPGKVEELINKCLHYQNEIEYELESAYFMLKKLRRWGKSKKEIEAQQHKIRALKDTEHVYLLQNKKFPTGLLRIVQSCLTKTDTPFKTKDLRIRPLKSVILPWRNKPFDPRYYQQEAIDKGIKEGRGVVVAAVGSGKLLISGYIIKELKVPTLFVVPSSGLSAQVHYEFKKWFGSAKVELLSALQVRKAKKTNSKFRPIRIMTIQSIAALKRTDDLQYLFQDLDMVMFDEFHHSAAKSYTDLQPDLEHIYFKIGFTGSFTRNDNKILSLWGMLSTVLCSYSAKQAISDGFLTPMEIVIHKVAGTHKTVYAKEYSENYCFNKDSQSLPMMEAIVETISTIDLHTKQILILVKLKEKCGKQIKEYLNRSGIKATFISGDDNKETINETIQAFNKGKIRVLIGSSVIGEGIDVSATDHFFMCQGQKSEINVVQGAGRLVRRHPGKTIGTYHDFRFVGTKFLNRHLKLRIEALKSHFDPQKISQINHLAQG